MGISGKPRRSCSAGDRDHADPPLRACGIATGAATNIESTWPAITSVSAGERALVWDVQHLHAGRERKELDGQVQRAAGPGGRIREHAGRVLASATSSLTVRTGTVGFTTNTRKLTATELTPAKSRARSYGCFAVRAALTGKGRGDGKERVAIGRGLRHVVRPDHAIGARTIVDHEGLPQQLAESLGERPHDRIVGAARS